MIWLVLVVLVLPIVFVVFAAYALLRLAVLFGIAVFTVASSAVMLLTGRR